ncbi:hypothetical protein STEG23_006130 [Scotinomys teguina]
MGMWAGDARTFWTKLRDDGEVDSMFEKAQGVLQSLKQKIKDGSATNRDYVQAMILVNEANISNSPTKDHIPMTQNEQENKSNAFPSTSCESSFSEDCTILSPGKETFLPVNRKEVTDLGKKEPPLSVSFDDHICSSACLTETPLSLKGGNPLQLPIRCHFQRRHAKTNSHSSALHVNYKTPCGRSLRNMEEVFHYLIKTECNFLFTDNFSFNTYVQLTRNYSKQDKVVSQVDISNGLESVPISFCNEIDSRKLPQFKYRRTVWPRAYYLNVSSMFSDSCDCSEGCIDIKKCACLQLTAKNAKACPLSPDEVCTGYKYKRLQRLIPTGIYECNLLCKCNHQMCQNRVIQHGPQVRLQVFKSEKKGWGVRCLDDIDRGTFVCIYSGRLLSRATPEKTTTDENGEEQNTVENTLSRKRKIEAACSDCETHARSPKTEKRSPEFSSDLREPVMEMNYRNISRTQRLSVIRRSKFKTAVFHSNEKNTGFVSSESTTPEDKDGFKPAHERLNSKARAHEDLSSNQVGYSEDRQLIESDVIDVTKSREDTSPEGRCKHIATSNNENTKKAREVPVKTSQEGELAASRSQQVFCDEKLRSERTKTPSPSLARLSKENVFLLDASREGNVGRFLNHSCSPNLCVQNVFVETHDRNFPLVAFFTNRYVKARTELTWDYGYEAGTMPEKEILCQCLLHAISGFFPNLQLYSSALVECEDHDNLHKSRNFAVKSVKKEIWRGRRLASFVKGHLEISKQDSKSERCTANHNHSSVNDWGHTDYFANNMLHNYQGPVKVPPKKLGRFKRHMTEEKDAIARVPFLKKCKEAGLLNELFEGILEKLDSIQGKLLNETASESDYEEIDTLLFDSGLFEDTLMKFQEVIRSKACEHKERQQQLKEQLEALGNLEQTLCSFQVNGDLTHSGSTSRSSLSP